MGRLISSATNTSAQAMSFQERWAWLPRGAAFVRSNDKEDQHYRGQTIKAQSEWYLFVVMVDKIRGLSGSLFILLVGFKKSGIGEGGGRKNGGQTAQQKVDVSSFLSQRQTFLLNCNSSV